MNAFRATMATAPANKAPDTPVAGLSRRKTILDLPELALAAIANPLARRHDLPNRGAGCTFVLATGAKGHHA